MTLSDYSTVPQVSGLVLPLGLADANRSVAISVTVRNSGGCEVTLLPAAQVSLVPPSLLSLAAQFAPASNSSEPSGGSGSASSASGSDASSGQSRAILAGAYSTLETQFASGTSDTTAILDSMTLAVMVLQVGADAHCTPRLGPHDMAPITLVVLAHGGTPTRAPMHRASLGEILGGLYNLSPSCFMHPVTHHTPPLAASPGDWLLVHGLWSRSVRRPERGIRV